jgi:hypothetical protein
MTAEDAALFGVAEVRAAGGAGPTETALRRQLAEAFDTGRLTPALDGALAESAIILAAAVDTAHVVGGLKGGYLAAQAQPAFQKALHALRMPTEVTPAPVAPPVPTEGQTSTPDWVRDAFGRPE